MKCWDLKQPTDNWGRGYAKLEHSLIGFNNVVHQAKMIVVTYGEADFSRSDIPDDNSTDCEWNGDCDDQEMPERCATCLVRYYDGLAQSREDNYRER